MSGLKANGPSRQLISSGTGSAAWQRGANENTNGLLRKYLPKGIDLTKVSSAKLAKAITRISHRPRKSLGYKTPSEVLQDNIRGALGF